VIASAKLHFFVVGPTVASSDEFQPQEDISDEIIGGAEDVIGFLGGTRAEDYGITSTTEKM
jgi:hypothetical protein